MFEWYVVIEMENDQKMIKSLVQKGYVNADSSMVALNKFLTDNQINTTYIKLISVIRMGKI